MLEHKVECETHRHCDRGQWPRVLVLGVGGGAVIKQLQVLFTAPEVVGIEYDATHLAVARRWFKVDSRRSSLIHADAQLWLQTYTGPKFDIVIDDLFADQCGEPVRTIPMTQKWSQTLMKNLNPGGLIIANFASRRELNSAALKKQTKICQCYRVEHPGYENSVGVFLTQKCAVSQFQKTLNSHRELNAAQRRNALNLRVTSLSR